MRKTMGTSRAARSLAAFALVTAAAAAFAALGGIDLAHSMIRLEQYGEVQDISIDKARPRRTAASRSRSRSSAGRCTRSCSGSLSASGTEATG